MTQDFKGFKERQTKHMEENVLSHTHLFRVGVDGDELWETYLSSFAPGTNNIFRERREFDCSCCKQFIRQFGDVVAINDGNELVSIWDFDAEGRYVPVVKALSELVHGAAVNNVMVTNDGAFGTDHNLQLLESGDVITWNHFRVDLPSQHIFSGDVNAKMAQYRDSKSVFVRSLKEITDEALETVLDLIAEKNLYRGEEWLPALSTFHELKQEFNDTPESRRDNWAWKKSVEIGGSVARIKNHSIGTLLNNLSDGMDVMQAIRAFEKVMAPANYKRPKPVYTRAMVRRAEATVKELGLLDSLPRRHARLADITVPNTLWINDDAVPFTSGGAGGVFDAMVSDLSVDPNKLKDSVKVMGIDAFMERVRGGASDIQILPEGRLKKNLVSLTAPVNEKSPSLFKWANAFSWAYSGNITDSSTRELVKSKGGNVGGVLRFSIRWNDDGDNNIDFDAHCYGPGRSHIYYRNKVGTGGGFLDVDIISPGGKVAVENISWAKLSDMKYGDYRFYLKNYSSNTASGGFTAEIEFDGSIFEFSYPDRPRGKQEIVVATVNLSSKNGFTLNEGLKSKSHSVDVWSIKTNTWQPVSIITFSPNYWDEQKGIGNKHYFFMIPGAANDESPNGFFNEYLSHDLMEHRRVFESLGSRMKCPPSDDQLSGLGFSTTRRESVLTKVDGQVIKVVF